MSEPDPRLTGAPQPQPQPQSQPRPRPEPRPARLAGPGPGRTEPWLIRSYLAALAARLPSSIVEELADGLTETFRFYVSSGQDAEEAATSAVAEFGSPETVVAGFAQVNPARRAARRLLRIGPVVGACWVAALLTSWPGRPGGLGGVDRAHRFGGAGGLGGAWAGWAVPGPAWVVTGLVLAGLIGLLAVAALGGRYRLAAATGVAGCFGFATLDVVLIIGAVFLLAPVGWITAAAIAASFARIAVTARLLRPALAR
jgi:hypothetical protein